MRFFPFFLIAVFWATIGWAQDLKTEIETLTQKLTQAGQSEDIQDALNSLQAAIDTKLHSETKNSVVKTQALLSSFDGDLETLRVELDGLRAEIDRLTQPSAAERFKAHAEALHDLATQLRFLRTETDISAGYTVLLDTLDDFNEPYPLEALNAVDGQIKKLLENTNLPLANTATQSLIAAIDSDVNALSSGDPNASAARQADALTSFIVANDTLFQDHLVNPNFAELVGQIGDRAHPNEAAALVAQVQVLTAALATVNIKESDQLASLFELRNLLGEKLEPHGRVIRVVSASYGDLATPGSDRTCDAQTRVSRACNGSRTCSYSAGLLCSTAGVERVPMEKRAFKAEYLCGLQSEITEYLAAKAADANTELPDTLQALVEEQAGGDITLTRLQCAE